MIFEITAIIGAITGSVSLAMVVYKTIKDRPNLHCELGDCYYFTPNENDNFTNFSVGVKIHNRGGRNTTIYNSNLLIKNNEKEFDLASSTFAFSVPQDSTIVQYFQFGLKKKDGHVEKEPVNSIMTLKHTYGEEKIEIKKIRKLIGACHFD